ncbi:MAG: hypothetical protein GY903_27820 [Fuerstiella sp.]|nr:hypothetical protein [Fuerstiella sp.]MCP4858304.1 hypothetical protein [Fuerstiella sp.]
MGEEQQTSVINASPKSRKSTRRFAFLITAATLAASVLLVVGVYRPHQVDAAMASLDRVIERAQQPVDRSYLIQVVEEFTRNQRPKNTSREAWNRESKDQLDGATLYVRGPDNFVLVHSPVDGRQRVSGYDGVESWSFREDSPVHVSSGGERFRGSMPGQQQTLPFLDMHASLTQLRENYDITLSEPHGERLSQLYGVRKSRDVRGPKEVDIWFNQTSGTVQRMVLYGLPPHKGSPKAVSLELIDQADLGPNFFSHEFHHQSDQPVRSDKRQR